MSKFTSLIGRAPKRFAAIAVMALAAIIVPTMVHAWGPDRPTFTTAKPAGYVTFNSITDNPAHGDERNFVQVKESGANNSTYAENVALSAGKEYTVFMYYHNNAASNLNDSGAGIAKGAYVKAELPAVVPNGSNGTKANGYVGASNARPAQVWDDISFSNKSGGDMAIRFVPGSAKIHSQGAVNGSTLSDSIVTTGAPIGYNALNGEVPGCNEFSGYVTFNVVADQPNFDFSKQVRLEGTKEWKENVEAKPGSTVEFQLRYQNTGTTKQNNVVMKDTLPKNLDYVPGSSFLMNSVNPNGVKVSDNLVAASGINVGHYDPKYTAYIKFSAKVNSNKEEFCKPGTLKNVARVETANGSKEDDATVTVPKQDCKPVAKYTCDNLAIRTLSRTEFRFTTNYTAENATFKSVKYTIRNAAGTVVDTKTANTNTLNYTQTTAGKFSVVAEVTFTVDGSDKTVTSNGCKGEFEVPALPNKITVCEIASKTIITIDEKDFNASIHTKDLDKCKETPVTPPTPETPPELPQTGVAQDSIAIVGFGALIASIAYFVASRRALNL